MGERTRLATNSSSTIYLVRNITSEWKTFYDLMIEICTGTWEWIESGKGFVSRDIRNKKARGIKIAPHSELSLHIASGDGHGLWSDSFRTGRFPSFVVGSMDTIGDPTKSEPLSSKHHWNI